MAGDLHPEDLLKSLEKGQLSPFYLFYGPGEFRLEQVLNRIRAVYIPESARDFNLEVLYAGEVEPTDITARAQTVPFLARNRLIIVRRTEVFTASALEKFLPYLEKPIASTCLIFVSAKTDFHYKFYKKIRSSGYAVNFEKLKGAQIVPWIRQTAKDLDLKINGQACAGLLQIVGDGLRDLHGELVKLRLRYGDTEVGVDQVKELAVHSRIYSVFELMEKVSNKDCAGSLEILSSVLEEEDKRDGPLRLLGMLNRQLRLLWQAKSIVAKGGRNKDVADTLGIPLFSSSNLVKHSKRWSDENLERGLRLLYRVDELLKSGSRPGPVLETLIISLCS